MKPWKSIIPLLTVVVWPLAASAQVQVLAPVADKVGLEAAPEEPPPPPQPETYTLTVSPAPEPEPALRYSLVPEYLDRLPGNSVPFYYRAILAARSGDQERWKPFHDHYEVWFDLTKELPVEDVKAFLQPFHNIFNQLHIATTREYTDWDWRLKDLEGLDVVAFIIEEIQESRNLGRLLYLKARVEVAERRYDDAIQTLRMGYQLAHDIGQAPTLINGLVGAAIASMMNGVLIELIDSPGAPNLYWALATLPRPLIDLRPAMRHELSMPLQVFPFLRDAETAERSDEEWNELPALMFEQLQKLNGPSVPGDPPQEPSFEARAAAAAMLLKGYPMARQELLEKGYPEKRLETMPVGQVVMIQQWHVYRHMHDEFLKWTLLPPAEAYARLRAVDDELKEDGYLGPGNPKEVIPVFGLLMPAVAQGADAYMRLQLRIDGLRTLEAIRMHAAANDGKLPASLDEITVVPVPENPITGKPFEYRLEGEKAVLDVPTPSGEPGPINWRFEITIAKDEDSESSGANGSPDISQ